MEPREAGGAAYMAHGIAARNPHKHASPDWMEWEKGYDIAMREDCGERCRHQSVNINDHQHLANKQKG